MAMADSVWLKVLRSMPATPLLRVTVAAGFNWLDCSNKRRPFATEPESPAFAVPPLTVMAVLFAIAGPVSEFRRRSVELIVVVPV